MSRVQYPPQPMGQVVPMVALANPPIPSLDPFTAILFQKFLERQVWLEYFVFSAVWNTLAASASGQQATTSLDPSIDFILMMMNLTAYSSAGTVVASPDYLLEVQENSGRSLFSDAPVHVSNWTGQTRDSGATPFTLPFPRYVRGNNVLTAKLTNNTNTAARVDLAYVGMRVTYLETSRASLFGVAF